MRLLLVEDERRLSEALSYILRKNNYLVDAAFDGPSGQEMAECNIYDVIILDRMLPGKEGLAVLRDLRKQNISTPVLILTAKDEIKDRVEGLDSGADDYLVKPFSTDELLARIRALSRRKSEQIQSTNLKTSQFELDPLNCEVTMNDQIIKLTLKESQLLELLIRNKGKVISRDQILSRVWGFDSDVDMNNIEIYIYYLRKKLNLKDTGVRIETIRGIGYSFREDNNV
ncbi:MAG TPA: response regulator transcription factor [Pseudobacteroides sp.]|uniref:response regulator transcription factor n=1 Tax=Pseudobacteroides sp. TaxID=1968840 RepID=UPI002F947B8A